MIISQSGTGLTTKKRGGGEKMVEFTVRRYEDHYVVIMPDLTKRVAESIEDILRMIEPESKPTPRFGVTPENKRKKVYHGSPNPYPACERCRKRHKPDRECGDRLKTMKQKAKKEFYDNIQQGGKV